jgi:hypothetical protein
VGKIRNRLYIILTLENGSGLGTERGMIGIVGSREGFIRLNHINYFLNDGMTFETAGQRV